MKTPRPVPASFFGIVLGLVGLGNNWRLATHVWGLPAGIGEAIMFAAAGVWLCLVALYLSKWLSNRPEAMAEARHPVLCCFIGLVPVSTGLIGLALLPYSRALAEVLFWVGAMGQLGFSLFRTGQLWKGGRDPNATTPVLYLPSVAGSFVSSIVASALGYMDLARLFFGAGVFSWLALESIVLHRLYMNDEMPKPLRPTLGIQLAPSVVGCVAYLGITAGQPDLFAQMLLGYGLLQALLLVRLANWFAEQPFAAAYWAFTFGVTALATSCLRFVDRGMGGPYVALAVLTFVAANLVVGWVSVRSIALLLRGGFAPPPLLAVVAAAPAVVPAPAHA